MITGRVYMIVGSEHEQVYIGSTIKSLAERFSQHKYKQNPCQSKALFNDKEVGIYLIEESKFEDKTALLWRERYYWDMYDTINKLRPICSEKEKKDYKTKYKETNKETFKEASRLYREVNKKKEIERGRLYREANKEKENKRARIYYQNNKETKKIYYQNNKETIKEYRKNNKEKTKEANRLYTEANKEKIKENQKKNYHYQLTWGGDKRSHNNLLQIDIDIFT